MRVVEDKTSPPISRAEKRIKSPLPPETIKEFYRQR